MAKNVITIPATKSRYTAAPLSSKKKRRVAAYARVSTDHEDQQSSYEAQVDYYTRYIKSCDDWEFVSIYTDEGISATNTQKREGFKTMIGEVGLSAAGRKRNQTLCNCSSYTPNAYNGVSSH